MGRSANLLDEMRTLHRDSMALLRLVRLIDAPGDYAVLAPLVAHEIACRLALSRARGFARSPSSAGARTGS
jgi:hypothetical protein